VNSLFHLRQVSLHQEQRTIWQLIVTTTVCALAILGILFFSLCSYVLNFIPCLHSTNTTIEPSTVTSNPSPELPEPSKRTHFPRNDEPQKDVPFTASPLKPAKKILIKIHAKMTVSKSLRFESSTRLKRDNSRRDEKCRLSGSHMRSFAFIR